LPGIPRRTYNLLYTFVLLLYNYNLNILLMALHEHPTLYHISLHLLLSGLYHHILVLYHCNLYMQLLCTWYSDYPAVSSEQRIHIILLLLYGRRSTRGTRKYSKVNPIFSYINDNISKLQKLIYFYYLL